MNCKDVQDRLITYLDDELFSDEAAQVQHHLAGCEACQQEMAALWKLQSRLSQSFQQQAAGGAPLPDAWTRLQVQLNQNTSVPKWVRWLGGWNMKQRRYVFAGIAAVLMIGFSLILVSTPAWAAMTQWFTSLFRTPLPNADGEMILFSEFAPLYPTYIPESFYYSGSLTGGESGSMYTELRYNDNNYFVILYEIQLQGDETLPDGQPTTIRGNPAVLQTGLAGTAQLIGGEQEGRPPGSGGGGGGGGGGPDTASPLFPESIDYTDGRQLTWFADGLYIELLTNLPEAELVKIAGSLVLAEEVPPEEAPPVVPPDVPPAEDQQVPPVEPDPALDYTPLVPSYLPTDLVILRELNIFDDQGGRIIEGRYYGFEHFLIIELSNDQGEELGEGEPVSVGDLPAVLTTGLAGTAFFDIDTLQDGTVSTGPTGGGIGGSVPDVTIYPTEMAYQDGLRLVWVQEGLHVELLTNLSLDELLDVAGSLVLYDGQGPPPWIQ